MKNWLDIAEWELITVISCPSQNMGELTWKEACQRNNREQDINNFSSSGIYFHPEETKEKLMLYTNPWKEHDHYCEKNNDIYIAYKGDRNGENENLLKKHINDFKAGNRTAFIANYYIMIKRMGGEKSIMLDTGEYELIDYYIESNDTFVILKRKRNSD